MRLPAHRLARCRCRDSPKMPVQARCTCRSGGRLPMDVDRDSCRFLLEARCCWERETGETSPLAVGRDGESTGKQAAQPAPAPATTR